MKARLGIIPLAALALPLSLAALPRLPISDSAALPSATIPSNGEMILLPVQVQDNSGKPLRGLGRSDFVLLSDGKTQPIQMFAELPGPQQKSDPPASVADPAAAVDRKFSSVPAGGWPQQLLILAIDLVNTGFQGHGEGQQELLKYLAVNLPTQPFDLVAITRDGLVQIHPFTSDRVILLQALQQLAATISKVPPVTFASDPTFSIEYSRLLAAFRAPPITGPYAWEIAARASLTALRQVAEAYAGVPGRKSVIWFSAGVRAMATDPTSTSMRGGSFQIQVKSPLLTDPQLRTAYDSAFRALNTADIAVYPLDLKPLKGDRIYLAHPPVPYSKPELDTAFKIVLPHDEPTDGLKIFAAQTGGRPCSVAGDLNLCISQALDDSAGYYLLAFNLPSRDHHAGWHKLDVKLVSGSSRVRSRSRYYLGTTHAPLDEEVRNYVMTAAQADLSYGGLAFTVERLPDSTGPADDPFNFRIRVPASSVLLPPASRTLGYEIATIALSEKGEPVNAVQITPFNLTAEQTQEAMAKGWRISESWPALHSMAAVKYVIRDNATGRIGSVTVPLNQNFRDKK